jgi:hypothetical protein
MHAPEMKRKEEEKEDDDQTKFLCRRGENLKPLSLWEISPSN